MSKKSTQEYIQSAVFGFNDALVSTTGVIVGVSTGTSSKEVVILAGVVTIMVEALSMGSGQYLSLKSAYQYSKRKDKRTPIISGFIMCGAYFLAGLVPLSAILIFPEDHYRQVAIGFALLALMVLGLVKGRVVGVSKLRSAVEMVVVGGLATLVGIVVGTIFGV